VDLRALRLDSGLTQAQLAERAGVSRQLVAAVEAHRHTPAVDAAIRLAEALGTSVETLFGSASTDDSVVVAVGEVADLSPVRLGRVGGQLVTAALADHGVAGAGWASADGVFEDGRVRRFPGAGADGVVVAGCDPALGIAEAMLSGRGDRSLIAISAPTGEALEALARGRIHAAVVHGAAGRLPRPPVPVTRWHFARWQVGVAIAERLAMRTLEDIVTAEVDVVQRDRAAASQVAFERACAAIGASPDTAGPRASGHLDGARTASILGSAAVTTEAAARAFGLAFADLEEHTVEVWVDERWLGHPGIDALGELLASAAFTDRVAIFGGYDLAHCGDRI
jgi:DNA-binding XRE family transcriptional regulator